SVSSSTNTRLVSRSSRSRLSTGVSLDSSAQVAEAQRQRVGHERPQRRATVLADDDDGVVAAARRGRLLDVAGGELPLEGDHADRPVRPGGGNRGWRPTQLRQRHPAHTEETGLGVNGLRRRWEGLEAGTGTGPEAVVGRG